MYFNFQLQAVSFYAYFRFSLFALLYIQNQLNLFMPTAHPMLAEIKKLFLFSPTLGVPIVTRGFIISVRVSYL